MARLLREEAASLIADLTKALEGRYIIGDVLGSGRGGIVVRAERVASGRAAALKVVWNDPIARERVWREMVLTSDVKHINVIPMRPVEVPDGMVVVEMPLASSGNVADLLDARTPVPYTRVLDIVRAAAGALGQAHAAGIVHGAFAPEKMLFDDAGNVWITDFALHIPPVPGWNVPRLSAIADPAYAAIELRHELPTTNARADQYSLAIIAYELLRGQRTWRVNDEGVLEIDAVEINVSRPIAKDAPLSAGMAIKRATSRDPGYRYDNISAFVRAFAGEGSEASAQHTYPDFVRRQGRQSAPWMLASLAVLIVGIVAVQPSTRELVTSWFYDDWSHPGPSAVSSTAQDPSGRSTTGAVAVTVDGNRRALVLIDGLPRGITPLFWEGRPGHHTVRLVGMGAFTPTTLSVDVYAGGTVSAAFGVPRR